MQRILPAFAIAALIHVALLTADTRWLTRRDSIAPRAQVISMQLVARDMPQLLSIRSLPAPPQPLPLKPTPLAVKPKPIVKHARPLKKKPPAKTVTMPPPPEVTSLESATDPEPAAAIRPVIDPVQTSSDASPPAVQTISRGAIMDNDQATDGPAGDKTAVVMATPRYSENPPPVYPAIARKRGYAGSVVLEVFVKADGRVGDLRIVDSSNHRLLDQAALRAVKHWHFEPGRSEKEVIAMWVRVPVDFRLH